MKSKAMKIKSMTATFGKLDRAHLEPGPGLTLIHAPNEGGKSTWAAFWRAMLYGIDTRDRDKKGYLADKNHYQPWSGAPMEGELVLELGGRDITIRRGPRGNVPFGSFSAVYTATQQPVPGLTASNCGELLTGVGAEVFARSAFLGGGDLSVTTTPELERRIASLVSSGQEDVSYSQALERLKTWKNRRQVNKSVGEIPKLENELAQIQEDLGRMEETAAQVTALEGERAVLERRRDALAQQAQAHKALARKRLSDRYVQAEEEYRTAQEQYTALEREQSRFGTLPDREELKQAQGELQYLKVLDEEIKQGSAALEEAKTAAAQAKEAARDDLFSEQTGDEAVAKAASECAEYQKTANRTAKAKRLFLPYQIIGVVWCALAILLGMYRNKGAGIDPYYLWLGLGAYGVCAVFSLAGLFRSKRLQKQAEGILAPYCVQTPEEVTALAQNYRERCQKAEKTAHEVEVIQNAVTERETKRDDTKTRLLGFVHQFAPEAQGMFGCSAALSRALNLEHDLSLARDRAEERRRRMEDLKAQGGQTGGEAAELPIPDLGAEETDRALALANSKLEQVRSQLDQARGTLQAMGDPAALSARMEEQERALARKRLELDALSAAMDALDQANLQLQERFSPEMDRLAGEYMSRLTGDRYAAVSLTRELDGFVKTGEGVLPRSVLYLSRGTADQLYLAVRLAVCQLCLPERPPILLDDALTAFDDGRLELALELLWELSDKQQILLFTCQKREGEAVGSAPGVTRIEL